MYNVAAGDRRRDGDDNDDAGEFVMRQNTSSQQRQVPQRMTQPYVAYPRQQQLPQPYNQRPLHEPMSEQHVPHHHRRTHRRTTFYYSSSSSGSQSPTDASRHARVRQIPYIEELNAAAAQDSDDTRVQLDRYSSMPSSPRYVGAPIVMWQNAEPAGAVSPVPSLRENIKQKRSVGIQAGRPKVKKFAFFSGGTSGGDDGEQGRGQGANQPRSSRVRITYDDGNDDAEQQLPRRHSNADAYSHAKHPQQHRNRSQNQPEELYSQQREPRRQYAASDLDNEGGNTYTGYSTARNRPPPRYSVQQPPSRDEVDNRNRRQSSDVYSENRDRGQYSNTGRISNSAHGSIRRHHVHVHDVVEARAVPPSDDSSPRGQARYGSSARSSIDRSNLSNAAQYARYGSQTPPSPQHTVITPSSHRNQTRQHRRTTDESNNYRPEESNELPILNVSHRKQSNPDRTSSTRYHVEQSGQREADETALSNVLQYLEGFGSGDENVVKSQKGTSNVAIVRSSVSARTKVEADEDTPQTPPLLHAIKQAITAIPVTSHDHDEAQKQEEHAQKHQPNDRGDVATKQEASYSSAPTTVVGSTSTTQSATPQPTTIANNVMSQSATVSHSTYYDNDSNAGILPPPPSRLELDEMAKEFQQRHARSFFRSPFNSMRRRKRENVAGKSLERVVALSQFSPNPVVKNAAINIDQRYAAGSVTGTAAAAVGNASNQHQASTINHVSTITKTKSRNNSVSVGAVSQRPSISVGASSSRGASPMVPLRHVAAGSATGGAGSKRPDMAANTLHALIHRTVEHGKETVPTLANAINQRQRELFVERVQHEMVKHAKRRGSSPAAVLFWMSRIGHPHHQHQHPPNAVHDQTKPHDTERSASNAGQITITTTKTSKPAGLYTPQLPRRHLGGGIGSEPHSTVNSTITAADRGYTSDVPAEFEHRYSNNRASTAEQEDSLSGSPAHTGSEERGGRRESSAGRRDSLINAIKKFTAGALGGSTSSPHRRDSESATTPAVPEVSTIKTANVTSKTVVEAASMPSSSGVDRESLVVVEVRQHNAPPVDVNETVLPAIRTSAAERQQNESQVHSFTNPLKPAPPPPKQQQQPTPAPPKPSDVSKTYTRQRRDSGSSSASSTSEAEAAARNESDTDTDNDTQQVPSISQHASSSKSASISQNYKLPDEQQQNPAATAVAPMTQQSKPGIPVGTASTRTSSLRDDDPPMTKKKVSSGSKSPPAMATTAKPQPSSQRASVSSAKDVADSLVVPITEESSLLSKSQEDLMGGDEFDDNDWSGENFDEFDPSYAAERLKELQVERQRRLRHARWDRSEKLSSTIQHERPRSSLSFNNEDDDAAGQIQPPTGGGKAQPVKLEQFIGEVRQSRRENSEENAEEAKIKIQLPAVGDDGGQWVSKTGGNKSERKRRSRSASPSDNVNANWKDFMHTMPKKSAKARRAMRRGDASWPGDVPSSAGGFAGPHSLVFAHQHLEQITEEKESPTQEGVKMTSTQQSSNNAAIKPGKTTEAL